MGVSSSQLEEAMPSPIGGKGRTTHMSSEPNVDFAHKGDAKAETLSDSKRSLCKRCRKLKLYELPLMDRPSTFDLGVPTSWDLSECSLCRFFWDLILKCSPSHQNSRVCFQSDTVNFDRCRGDPNPVPSERVGYLSAARISTRGWAEFKTFTPPIAFMHYGIRPKFGGKTGVGAEVNFGVINNWLDRCKLHVTCHQPSNSIEITLINCKTRALERRISTEAYVALSYVWGASSTETRPELLSIGSRLSDLPLLIEDALLVCNKINIQYLWVDRYCISQDPEESHRQIANMDAVYREAVLTIIAAACDTPDSGLPGVSKIKRVVQSSLRIGDWVLIPCLQSPQAIVLESKWNSRGWTYQEAILSSRRLYFTNDQVVFECQNKYFEEASATIPWHTARSGAHFLEPTAYDVGTGRPHLFASHNRMAQKDIWALINSYSSRSLTYPSDVLNAMLGVLRFFSRKELNPLYHHWGIPFQFEINDPKRHTDSAKEFLRSLLWGVNEQSTRREGFPSWSWTGWMGRTGKDSLTYYQTLPEPTSSPNIVIELKNGIYQTWQEFTDTFQMTDPSLFSIYIHITIPTLKLPIMFSAVRVKGTYFVSVRWGKDFPSDYKFPFSLTRLVEPKSDLHSRIIKQPLICMVLSDPGAFILHAMVLIEENGCFERLGYIWSKPVEKTWHEKNTPSIRDLVLLDGVMDLSSVKNRTIRLG